MSRRTRTILTSTAAALVLCLTGCAGPSPNHEKAVNAARQRALDARSVLVLGMAQRYFDAGDLDQAENSLMEAVAVDPSNPRLHLLAGRVALERAQLERAHGRFERAIELEHDLSDARYYQGIVFQRWQKYDAALARYREAYDLQPDNVAFLLAVGEMLVATDHVDQAIRLFADKLTYFAQNAAIRMALGQLYMTRRDYSAAVPMFREALLLHPGEVGIEEELAAAYLVAGNYDEAIKLFESLSRRAELNDRADLRRSLARAYQAAGRTGAAREMYQRLRRENPRDVDAWIHLAELAWVEKDAGATLTCASRAIELAPQRHEGYLLAGMVWQKRGDWNKALELFDKAAQWAPQGSEPWILRGVTLQQSGQHSAAAAAYAEALRRQPEDRRAKDLLMGLASVTDTSRH